MAELEATILPTLAPFEQYFLIHLIVLSYIYLRSIVEKRTVELFPSAPRDNYSMTSQTSNIASTSEVDAIVSDEVNILYFFKDNILHEEYQQFNLANQSLASMFTTSVAVTVFSVPLLVMLCAYWVHCNNSLHRVNCIVLIIFFVCAILASWRLYFYFRHIFNGQAQTDEINKRRLQDVQKYLFTALHIVCCYMMLVKVSGGPCERDVSLFENLYCNNLSHSNAIPLDMSAILVSIPLIFSVSARGAHYKFALVLWAISTLTLIAAALIAHGGFAVLFILFSTCASLLVIVESRRLNFVLFFTHRKLRMTMQERQKAADEENALEMRYLIANIAHDMKTVSSSRLSDIWCIIYLTKLAFAAIVIVCGRN